MFVPLPFLDPTYFMQCSFRPLEARGGKLRNPHFSGWFFCISAFPLFGIIFACFLIVTDRSIPPPQFPSCPNWPRGGFRGRRSGPSGGGSRPQQRFGSAAFGFAPETYVLPGADPWGGTGTLSLSLIVGQCLVDGLPNTGPPPFSSFSPSLRVRIVDHWVFQSCRMLSWWGG